MPLLLDPGNELRQVVGAVKPLGLRMLNARGAAAPKELDGEPVPGELPGREARITLVVYEDVEPAAASVAILLLQGPVAALEMGGRASMISWHERAGLTSSVKGPFGLDTNTSATTKISSRCRAGVRRWPSRRKPTEGKPVSRARVGGDADGCPPTPTPC
jgi:hypothetical protein